MDHFHIALSDDQLRAVSSIGLAHVGDAVYELLVRTWLCAHGRATGKDLHRAAIALVCAPEQARRAQRILPLLTAGVHLAFAFPLIYKMLILFGVMDLHLLILTTASCYLVFAVLYTAVYRITSGAYYGIVSGAR